MSLKDCVPYTTYFVSMKAKPRKSLDQYWSDVTTQNVTTKPDGKYPYAATTKKIRGVTSRNKTEARKTIWLMTFFAN